ncbi:hypothetical protein [Flavobacterium sp.]|uniref:hypothetical protein n=1 Tax=Flavobacterium sp. TaxID=239 RepID=UPI0040334DD6
MKNTILFFALLISVAALAQFPSKNPELLIGHEVKVRPLFDYEIQITNEYSNFYTSSKMLASYVYMPGGNGARTRIDALQGHTFKVIGVEADRDGSPSYYKITLQKNDEIIYYKYGVYSISYLEPVNFTLPDDYYCNFIEKWGDEPNILYNTSKSTNRFVLYKYIDKGESDNYQLRTYVQIQGMAPESGTVTFVLDNGKKLSYPKIKFSYHVGIAYSSIVDLSKADIKALTESNIKEVYFDKWMADLAPYSEELKGILKCLITKK